MSLKYKISDKTCGYNQDFVSTSRGARTSPANNKAARVS
jgi:hypothetical protein